MWNNKRYTRIIAWTCIFGRFTISTGNILISNILKLILEWSDEYYDIYIVLTMMRDLLVYFLVFKKLKKCIVIEPWIFIKYLGRLVFFKDKTKFSKYFRSFETIYKHFKCSIYFSFFLSVLIIINNILFVIVSNKF